MTQQQGSSGSSSPLVTDKGTTSIAEAAVSQIAGVAAQEIEGVQMGGGSSAAVGGFLQSMTGAVTGGSSGGAPNYSRGVSTEVGQEEAAFDLTMAVEYGKAIPQVVEAVRRNVINRVEGLTGLRVTEVNISVTDVQFKEERPMLEQQEELKQSAQREEQREGIR